MEQKEVQLEEGIRIGDILKLLLSKAKLLVLSVLIGALLGGSFAVWRTYDVDYWGTSIEFYVNPEKPKDNTNNDSQYGVYGAYGQHVMDNMIRLLSSESFTEQMILNGDELPKKDVWVNLNDPVEVALDLNAKIDAAQVDLDALNVEKEKILTLNEGRTEKVLDLSIANENLNTEWKKLYYGDLVTSATFNETEYLKKVQSLEDTVYQPLHDAYQVREDIQAEIDVFDRDLKVVQQLREDAEEVSDVTLNIALEAWRKTAKYKTTLGAYGKALKYSYLEDDHASNTNNLARSFIYVKINVLNDKAFAELLLERVKTVVPSYVEANMTVPSGYTGTNCQRLTRTDDIRCTNPGYTTDEAVKAAVLVGIVAFIIACGIIILLDKSDKRLRDTEVITKSFNVPILGIIPTIEELKQELAHKKKNGKKNTEVK